MGLKRIRTHHGKIPAKNSVRTVHATSGVTSSVNIVASGPALLRLVRVQGELLDSPIREFADQNFVVRTAINFMYGTEILQLLSRPTELAEDRPV